MNSLRVLALLPLFVGLAHSFSWDVVVGADKELEFFYNGSLTHTEHIPAANYITSVTYDPVHDRVLFADNHNTNTSISSFDISTKKIQHLVTRLKPDYFYSLAYDPVTQLLFWAEDKEIYSLSLKSASSNKTVDVNLLLTLNGSCYHIVVDSCGGYLYWITDSSEIERARLNGSESEVVMQSSDNIRFSLAIDQYTHKIYWTDTTGNYRVYKLSIKSANFNGKNRSTYYIVKTDKYATSLAVSENFIYWFNYNLNEIWQLPKNRDYHVEAKLISKTHKYCRGCQFTAINYSIKELTKRNPNCTALSGLISNSSNPIGESKKINLLCVHGTNVSGESRCECKQGYTGERCDVSLCHNYCLQGECSVSAEGQPKCRCKAGYSGARCEVNACHKHCLNGGVCYLNQQHEPVCQCTRGFEGERCDVALTHTDVCDNMMQQMLLNLRSEVKQVIREELQRRQ